MHEKMCIFFRKHIEIYKCESKVYPRELLIGSLAKFQKKYSRNELGVKLQCIKLDMIFIQ